MAKVFCYKQLETLENICNTPECEFYAACSSESAGEEPFSVVMTEEERQAALEQEVKEEIEAQEKRKKGFQLDFEEEEFTPEGMDKQSESEKIKSDSIGNMEEKAKKRTPRNRFRVRGVKVNQ